MKAWNLLGLTAVAAASLCTLTACATKPDPMDGKATASITSYNHTPDGGKVRLIISNWVAGHPNYPGPAYPVKPANFRFEPSRRAAREAEERARVQAEGRAQLEAEMRAMQGGASVQKALPPSSATEVKLPPPPLAPKDEK